ncbi:MAG: hypothetical protein WCS03_19180, partial [Bacteroidota bacterium]
NLFNNTQIFVGIELIPDITPPLNYIEIDHHNENSHKKSALEQIIELLENDLNLKIEFTRDLQLIAANDKGYIPGMITLGATPEEVAEIRRRDRKAQGATDEDELLAVQSINENCTYEGGITIIKSLTTKFSAITDRLYPCESLLIYTKHELNYYGKGVSKLIIAFDDLIKQQKAYSGGGGNGFFGIKTESDIQISINQLISILINEKHGINGN